MPCAPGIKRGYKSHNIYMNANKKNRSVSYRYRNYNLEKICTNKLDQYRQKYLAFIERKFGLAARNYFSRKLFKPRRIFHICH